MPGRAGISWAGSSIFGAGAITRVFSSQRILGLVPNSENCNAKGGFCAREISGTRPNWHEKIFFYVDYIIIHVKNNFFVPIRSGSSDLAGQRFASSVTVFTTGDKLQDLLAAEHPTPRRGAS